MKIGWLQLIGILAVAGLLLLAGYGLAIIRRATEPAPIEIIPPQPSVTALPTSEPLPAPTAAPLRVYVSGAVMNPAVYTLPPGSIIDDAVQAAGGFAPDADPVAVNLAQELLDGMQIYVPLTGEAAPPPLISAPSPIAVPDSDRLGGLTIQGLIDINSASARELEMLPGIGPVTAEKIIAYREANGPFATIEAIMEVPGIGEAKFAAIRDLITVVP
jgi:competence protein ComEA